jgi:uncharacterized protein YdhG (YjbR/CyaY superfamily)
MDVKTKSPPNDFESYISGFPPPVGERLKQIREIVGKAAPDAREVISYGMPAFRLNGILVYFAGYKKHIGFYPTSSGIEAFKSELEHYKWSKGAIQFPNDRPLPVELIRKITRFRVEENLIKSLAKKK